MNRPGSNTGDTVRARWRVLALLATGAAAVAALFTVGLLGCRQASAPAQEPAQATATVAQSAVPASAVTPVVDGRGVTTDAVCPAVHAGTPTTDSDSGSNDAVPSWAADAIFYQIFPGRFYNGDPANDPTRESLEDPARVPTSWKLSPWTGDWYERADWEQQLGGDFYQDGVFDRRYGGDLQGVIDKLDYLKGLGVNAIYFNPVFYARSLHKYDGNTFHHVDPYFGPDPKGDLDLMAEETSDPASWHWTAADKLFLDLIRQAHQRGIRVIIDGVFNHTGRDFFAFADLRRRQVESPYRDWYIVQTFDDPNTPQNEFRYRGWWGVDTLPEFANDASGHDLHPGPKKYIFDSTTRWMDPNGDGDPADGLDGWRLDVANEVPTGFWRDWHAHLRRINPDAYTVAEMWGDASDFLRDGGFSATMNYHGFAFPAKGFLIDGVLSASDAARQLDQCRECYPPAMQFALQNLVDSHDTDRLASMIVNARLRPYSKPERFDYDINVSPRYVPDYDVRKPNAYERRVQRLVALLQMTYVGPPMIYYGTEAGMWGADDPDDRQPMVWPDLSYDPQRCDPLSRPREADAVTFDRMLFDYYRAAIGLRNERGALRCGGIKFVTTDDPAEFFAFQRQTPDETLLVGLNRGSKGYAWEVPLAGNQALRQIFTASGEVGKFHIDRRTDRAIVTVPACDGVVLELRTLE